MSDKDFPDGLMAKRNDNAPDYAICKLSVKKSAFIPWLQQQDKDWVNFEVKRSKGGKIYVSVDTWEPDQAKVDQEGIRNAKAAVEAPKEEGKGFIDDTIPF